MNKLAEELLSLPETIQNLELQMLDNFGKKQEVDAAVDIIKAQVDQAIAEEVGEDGKVKHGNEFKRKAESVKRLAADDGYLQAFSESSELQLGSKKLEIKLRFFQNKLKVLSALAQGRYFDE